jgi:hypothetical protein
MRTFFLYLLGMRDYEVLGEGFEYFFFKQEMIGFAVEEIQSTFLCHALQYVSGVFSKQNLIKSHLRTTVV